MEIKSEWLFHKNYTSKLVLGISLTFYIPSGMP